MTGLGRHIRRRRTRVPVKLQSTLAECGVACLAMVLSHWGRDTELREIRDRIGVGRDGASMRSLAVTARSYGLEARAFRVVPDRIAELTLPAIAFWEGSHFVVVERIDRDVARIVDPGIGRLELERDEFDRRFSGVVLQLEPTEALEQRKGGTRFWSFVRPYVPRNAILLATTLVVSLLLVGFALIPPAITELVVDEGIRSDQISLFRLLMLGAVVMAAANGVVRLCRAELLLWLQTAIDRSLMTSFLRHLLALPYSYFQVRRGGDLLVRASSTAYVRDAVSSQLIGLLIDGFMISVYLVLIGLRSVEFVVAMVVLAVVQVAVIVTTADRAQNLAQVELAAMGESSSALLETIGGIESLKSSGAEGYAYERWADHFRHQLTASVRRRRLSQMVEAAVGSVSTLTPVALLLVGAIQVVEGRLDLGEMLALVALAGGALAPISSIGSSLQALQTIRVHLERLRDVLEEEVESELGGDRRASSPFPIVMRSVSYAYSADGAPAVRDFSLTIDDGQTIAIVGRTGSGKSTAARLITGLLRPGSGELRYGGIPIGEVDVSWLRSHSGVVTQSTELLSGSIRSNLALNRPDATDDDLVLAATMAQIHDEISAMPLGYDTPLGESGKGLSGGQLQRLALARALVGKPRLLVLDEATSHLDAVTERRIFDNLAAVPCATVVIAHRLSTIQNSDLIVVLEDGEVKATGDHTELLATSPIYRHLVHYQSGQPTSRPALVPALAPAGPGGGNDAVTGNGHRPDGRPR